MEKFEQIGNNLLEVIAYGDASGLPFETKSSQTVGSVTELPSIEHNEYLDIPELLKGAKGVWSDDTHLSLASAKSINRQLGFDLLDQAQIMVDAYEHVGGVEDDPDLVPAVVTKDRHNGFGGSTVNSIERLRRDLNPRRSGEVGGAGNGVLMKMAPLTFWQYAKGVDPTAAERQVTSFTRMTHHSREAIVCSLVHRTVLGRLLLNSENDNPDLLRQIYRDAIDQAVTIESTFGVEDKTSKVLKRLEEPIVYGFPDGLDRKDVLEAAPKHGFYAPETLVMAYGSFLIEDKFPESVYRAVELGGDSDSIGSIVGTMSLFYHGEIDKPTDIEELFAVDRLRRISAELTKVAFNGLM